VTPDGRRAVAEVLRASSIDIAPVRLPGPTELDRSTAELLALSYEEGRASGWREGHRAGRDEAADFAAQVGGALERALDRYGSVCADTRHQLADHLVELAEALVEGVLGHLPDTATAGMLDRLRAALTVIDDGPLTVHVHPSTLELMQPALTMRAGGHPLTCRPDGALAPGEMVVEGPWAFAELTWPRLLDAARSTLRELQDAGCDATFDHDPADRATGSAS
jgi:hypothetical protein